MLNELLAKHSCTKCEGRIQVDPDILPDNTYEVYCLNCGNRSFPSELVIAVNLLFKLKSKTLL